jgi:hypothetical protein
MEIKIKTFLAALVFIIFTGAGTAFAYPVLQLTIDTGTYDWSTETWVSSTSSFNLTAFATKALTDVRLAVALGSGVAPSNGTISIDGFALAVADFVYGLPPFSTINPDGNGGDLAPHEIYPTYFAEYIFDFTTPASIYDTQPGGQPGTKLGYREDFVIDISGFDSGHFDLYTLKGEDRIHKFAPPSHDAEYGSDNLPVSEPGTMILLGISLITTAVYVKRVNRKE